MLTNDVLVFAIHPDDETLGCGGTLLRHKENGDRIHWLIATKISENLGFPEAKIALRNKEIETISKLYKFDSVHHLDIETTRCEQYPISDLTKKISDVFNNVKPQIIYLPFKGDAHSDHRFCFDAAFACTKSFRYPFIEKVLMMETLSETDFSLPTQENQFIPQVFVDISDFITKKCDIMSYYKSELGKHPFPRSIETIQALAKVRGAACGAHFAESFMLLKEIQK